MPRRYTTPYPPEFRTEAVRLVRDGSRPISVVAKDLGVSDEPDIRFMMRLILESAGYKVTEARHGAIGLKSVRTRQPDLVITDVMMPTMDGLEFIESLRSNSKTAAIPILVVSGNSDLATAANARLRKPFTRRELLHAAALLIREDVG